MQIDKIEYVIPENNNPLGLKFIDPTRPERLIQIDILQVYKPDDWGLTPDNVMLEIGANSGAVSMHCAKKYGCKVYAYEPAPATYDLLVKNICINELENLIFTFPYAVTKDGRPVHVKEYPQNRGSGNIYLGGQNDPIVPSIALKRIIEELREAKEFIQVLLMDCEGAEFELLEDLEPLRGIPKFRGEFHDSWEVMRNGKIEDLLERVKTVIPDSNPYLQKHRHS
jgi:FkbM family methyltransferase